MTPSGAPVHLVGEVLATKRAGAHRVLTLAVPGIPEAYRPGTFVALSQGADRLARRAFWIMRVTVSSAFGPTIDVLVDPVEGTGRWLAGLPVGTRIPVTGPLGRPFSTPRHPLPCLLVGEGRGVAPLLGLAERLRERECPVTLLMGAADEKHLVQALDARRLVRRLVVVTGDGSVGLRGRVLDHLAEALVSSGAQVLYAVGDATFLAPLARAAEEAGIASQVALEQPMPCGTGLCHGCVVRVRSEAGEARLVRGCVEGPVFPGDRVDLEVSA